MLIFYSYDYIINLECTKIEMTIILSKDTQQLKQSVTIIMNKKVIYRINNLHKPILKYEHQIRKWGKDTNKQFVK